MFLNKKAFREEYGCFVDFFNSEYNYCYLDSMHYLNKTKKPHTIITGISYALDGINPLLFKDYTLNFAMHSQDLYYDCKHIEKALSENGEIKNCIISLGYYSLYYDMSLASTKDGIQNRYYPLFHDTHHYDGDVSNWIDYSKDEYREYRDFAHSFFENYPAYFGKAVIRENFSLEINSLGGWSNLSDEKRNEYAQFVSRHNHHIIHKETFRENVEILNNLVKLLAEKNINTYFVIMPFTEEYLREINPDYKKNLLEVLDNIPYSIDFLDMNDLGLFEREDFLDLTHVNANGAKKVTYILEQLLEGNL